jgi:transposase
LLPPSLREWIDDDHLAWLVLAVVGEIDLGEFYGAYRADGHGRPAHDPAMMVALLLYSYALGQRSSRAIERRCHEDVPTRVICANQAPDHTTIARFRARHQDALAQTFTQLPVDPAGGRSDAGRGRAGRCGRGRRARQRPRRRAARRAGRPWLAA